MTDEQLEKIIETLYEITPCSGISDRQVEDITKALYDISEELMKIRYAIYDTLGEIHLDLKDNKKK